MIVCEPLRLKSKIVWRVAHREPKDRHVAMHTMVPRKKVL